MKVSMDFDGTLEYKSIQEYAKELIARGIDVWVVTSRFGDDEKYKLFFRTSTNVEITNTDLFEITNALGILKEKIVFTDMIDKYHYFEKHPEFIWHLDDDWVENRNILNHTKVKAVSAFGNPNWKQKCERLLKNV